MIPNSDPRIDQAAVSDESLLAAHEKLLGKQPDDKARYQPMPLVLLFVFAGLLFFGATYLNRYSGHFDPLIYNENLRSRADLKAGPAVAVDPVVLGKKLFNDAACNTCHQATGLGQPGAIPPLVGSEWAQGSEERVIRIVLHGLQGPITVKGANFNSAMPAFGKGVPASMKNWSDDKIAAVLTYVRQEWGNQAPPITADKVTEIHNKEADHKPWTADELQKIQ
jgi:mono/diheme cytochrome c family protein